MARRDNERAAKILVEAYLGDDATVCDKYGVTLRTLQRYREALRTDAELSLLFAEHLRLAQRGHWSEDLDRALSAATRKLSRLIERLDLPTPDAIRAVTEAIEKLADIALTREVLSEDAEQGEAAQAHERGDTLSTPVRLN